MKEKNEKSQVELDAEQVLAQIENRRKAEAKSTPRARLEALRAGLRLINKKLGQIHDAISNTGHWIDERGQRCSRVNSGIPNNFPPDALVMSNISNLRPLIEAGERAYLRVRRLIDGCERDASQIPLDAEKFLHDLLATIPAVTKKTREKVVYQTPKLAKNDSTKWSPK